MKAGTFPAWPVHDGDVGAPADSDGDGVADAMDNCLNLANANQHDTDGDGYGNRCDGDFNQDGVVNPTDLGIMRANFFVVGDLVTDLNGDGVTNSGDLGIFRTQFFGTPGPSGSGGACDP